MSLGQKTEKSKRGKRSNIGGSSSNVSGSSCSDHSGKSSIGGEHPGPVRERAPGLQEIAPASSKMLSESGDDKTCEAYDSENEPDDDTLRLEQAEEERIEQEEADMSQRYQANETALQAIGLVMLESGHPKITKKAVKHSNSQVWAIIKIILLPATSKPCQLDKDLHDQIKENRRQSESNFTKAIANMLPFQHSSSVPRDKTFFMGGDSNTTKESMPKPLYPVEYDMCDESKKTTSKADLTWTISASALSDTQIFALGMAPKSCKLWANNSGFGDPMFAEVNMASNYFEQEIQIKRMGLQATNALHSLIALAGETPKAVDTLTFGFGLSIKTWELYAFWRTDDGKKTIGVTAAQGHMNSVDSVREMCELMRNIHKWAKQERVPRAKAVLDAYYAREKKAKRPR